MDYNEQVRGFLCFEEWKRDRFVEAGQKRCGEIRNVDGPLRSYLHFLRFFAHHSRSIVGGLGVFLKKVYANMRKRRRRYNTSLLRRFVKILVVYLNTCI